MMAEQRRVAVVGSSGGGAATLARTAKPALDFLVRQLRAAGIAVAGLQFIECEHPLDAATESCAAALWALEPFVETGVVGGAAHTQVHTPVVRVVARGTLAEVNAAAREHDAALAATVESLDGLVMISADVCGVNTLVFEAAARARDRLAVVGTGGTSVGAAMAAGVNVINGGGSVATTSATRAVAFASALAAHWRLSYRASSTEEDGGWHLHSVLDGCLPAFLAVYVAGGLARHLGPTSAAWADAFLAERGPRLLCTVTAVVAAQQSAGGLEDTALMAGALAGGCVRSSVPAALLAGVCASQLCRRLLVLAFGPLGFPATAATISAVGGAGLASGLVTDALVAPCLGWATRFALASVDSFLRAHPIGGAVAGAGAGVFVAWGSQRGLYHFLFLPAILVEMEGGQGALLGTLDEATLVMPSLAVCLASRLLPRRSGTPAQRQSERRAAGRGVAINARFGDYIEAGYPFFRRDPWVHAAVYVGCAAAGALTAAHGVRSSAYLPLPLAIGLSHRPAQAACVFLAAFLPPFSTQLVRNWCC